MGLLLKFPLVERVSHAHLMVQIVLIRMNTHGNILYFLFCKFHKETQNGISVALLTVEKYNIQYQTGCLKQLFLNKFKHKQVLLYLQTSGVRPENSKVLYRS